MHIGERSPLSGRSLIDAGLRQRFGVVVVGIRRASGQMDFNPEPDTAMRAGDDLVVLGRSAVCASCRPPK
ncbi:MAG: cation:proton antiporter regulatory subunit [Vicinamibacterales bacterium]